MLTYNQNCTNMILQFGQQHIFLVHFAVINSNELILTKYQRFLHRIGFQRVIDDNFQHLFQLEVIYQSSELYRKDGKQSTNITYILLNKLLQLILSAFPVTYLIQLPYKGYFLRADLSVTTPFQQFFNIQKLRSDANPTYNHQKVAVVTNFLKNTAIIDG